MKRPGISPLLLLLLVYAFVAILLTQFPLVNSIGYEFSSAMGVAASVGGGWLALSLFRKRFAGSERIAPAEYTAFLRKAVLLNYLALLIPVGIITLNGLAIKTCSIYQGFAFVLLIPFVSVLFCTALAGIVALVVRRARLTYFFLLAVILISPLLHAYFEPQLFSYNALYGYFPGFSYDELLPITSTLILYRGLVLCAAVVLMLGGGAIAGGTLRSDGILRKIGILVTMGRRRRLIAVSLPLMTVLLLAYWYRNELSFETSAAYIQKVLGSKFSTQHFDIYYSRAAYSDAEIRRIAGEHEFRFMQLLSDLRTSPRSKIQSYIYPTDDIKRRLLGTATTDIARPWMREIHIGAGSVERTLKHELVHVMAARFGLPLFGVSLRMGLIEGLATALGGETGDRTLHQYAAGMKEFGTGFDLQGLLSYTGFLSQPPARGYVVCGSFVEYLVDRYGIERFKRMYGTGNFQSGYGRSMQSLIDEWNDFLTTVAVPDSDEAHIVYRFRRQTIFRSTCPRATAEWLDNAGRFFRQKKYAESARLYNHAYAETGNPEAFLGYLRAYFAAGRYDSVIASVQRSNESNLQPYSHLLLGDAYIMTSDTMNARQTYHALYQSHVYRYFDELASIRLAWLSRPGWNLTMRSFYSAENDSLRIVLMKNRLVSTKSDQEFESFCRYLLLRLTVAAGNYEEAATFADDRGPVTGDPVLNYSRELLTAAVFEHHALWEKAKIHYWRALNYTLQQAEINAINDRIEMCEWFTRHQTL